MNVMIPCSALRASAWFRIGTVLIALAASACAAAPRQRPVKGGDVDQGAGTLAAARKYLEGRWSLLSFEITQGGQPPLRVNGNGTLSYDEYGNLDMQIRVDDAGARALETAGIITDQGVLAASGRTAVDMTSRTLTYLREGQKAGFERPLGPLGITRPRHWEVNGDVLTLTTTSADGKDQSVGRWQKVP